MSKQKHYEVPNKEDWDRKEYLDAKKRLSEVTGEPFQPHVFCYNCKKLIEDRMLHVVQFGKSCACNTCYTKKGWGKLRRQVAKFAIPTNLQDQFYDMGELVDGEPPDVEKSVDTGAMPSNNENTDAPLKP